MNKQIWSRIMLTGVLIASAPLEAQVLGGGVARGAIGGAGGATGAAGVGNTAIGAAGSGGASATGDVKTPAVDEAADSTAKARNAANGTKDHVKKDTKKAASQTSADAKTAASHAESDVSNTGAQASTSGNASSSAGRNGVNASGSQTVNGGVKNPKTNVDANGSVSATDSTHAQ